MDRVNRYVREMCHLRSLVTDLTHHGGKVSIPPVLNICSMRDGVEGDFMACVVQLVDQRVVGVLVADEEGGCSAAAVGVEPIAKQLAIQHHIVDVHAIVKGQ